MAGLLYAIETTESLPQDITKHGEKGLERLIEFFPHMEGIRHLNVTDCHMMGTKTWLIAPNPPHGIQPKLAFRPNEQRWLECDPHVSQRCWVGCWTGSFSPCDFPDPRDLQKKKVFNRYILDLSILSKSYLTDTWWKLPVIPVDIPTHWSSRQKEWVHNETLLNDLMPLAEKYHNRTSIVEPMIVESQSLTDALEKDDLDEDVRRQYLHRLSEIEDHVRSMQIPDEERVQDVLKIIAFNYHISQWEAELLELLTPESCAEIIALAVQDREAIQRQLDAREKKG